MPKFDEDTYRNNQLDKYLREISEEPISNCCGVYVLENTDICSKCLEHCEATTAEDRYQDHLNEQADIERDEEKL